MWTRALILAVLAVAAREARAAIQMDEDMAELARLVRESCAAESGADVALVERVNGGADLPPDPALKCYLRCTMETAGMMADGHVDVDAVLAMLPADHAAHNGAALRACGTQTGSDACDTAYRTQQCWQRANPRDYFLI